jgi:hypothetical protein
MYLAPETGATLEVFLFDCRDHNRHRVIENCDRSVGMVLKLLRDFARRVVSRTDGL